MMILHECRKRDLGSEAHRRVKGNENLTVIDEERTKDHAGNSTTSRASVRESNRGGRTTTERIYSGCE